MSDIDRRIGMLLTSDETVIADLERRLNVSADRVASLTSRFAALEQDTIERCAKVCDKQAAHRRWLYQRAEGETAVDESLALAHEIEALAAQIRALALRDVEKE